MTRNYWTCDDCLVRCVSVELLCCAPETKIILKSTTLQLNKQTFSTIKKETVKLLSKWLPYHFAFPSVMYGSSDCSASLPALGIIIC